MAGNRANVLRAVFQTLEGYSPLRNFLKHKVGAATVATGARILGDDTRIDELPLPSLVLGFDGGTVGRDMTSWNLTADAYTKNVFDAATVLDHLEMLAADWVRNPNLVQPLNNFRVDSHERLDAVGPAGRLIAVRINLEVSWIS